jgi:hypothetical protein
LTLDNVKLAKQYNTISEIDSVLGCEADLPSPSCSRYGCDLNTRNPVWSDQKRGSFVQGSQVDISASKPLRTTVERFKPNEPINQCEVEQLDFLLIKSGYTIDQVNEVLKCNGTIESYFFRSDLKVAKELYWKTTKNGTSLHVSAVDDIASNGRVQNDTWPYDSCLSFEEWNSFAFGDTSYSLKSKTLCVPILDADFNSTKTLDPNSFSLRWGPRYDTTNSDGISVTFSNGRLSSKKFLMFGASGGCKVSDEQIQKIFVGMQRSEIGKILVCEPFDEAQSLFESGDVISTAWWTQGLDLSLFIRFTNGIATSVSRQKYY